MLIVRFNHFAETFRDRQMEWALAAGAAGWGAIVLSGPETFERPFYAPLVRIAGATTWGWSLFLIGVLSLTVLFINGSWRRTPFFRQCFSVGRMVAWSALFFGCLSVEWRTPAAMIYAMILFMEIMAMSNATADGKRVRLGIAARGN